MQRFQTMSNIGQFFSSARDCWPILWFWMWSSGYPEWNGWYFWQQSNGNEYHSSDIRDSSQAKFYPNIWREAKYSHNVSTHVTQGAQKPKLHKLAAVFHWRWWWNILKNTSVSYMCNQPKLLSQYGTPKKWKFMTTFLKSSNVQHNNDNYNFEH